MAELPDPTQEIREKVRTLALAKYRKLGRKLTPKEFGEIVNNCLNAERAKKNGHSVSNKNQPPA